MSEPRPNRRNIRCEEMESLALLYACGELDDAARSDLDAHIAQCSQCDAVLARELRLHEAIAALDQPADSLDRSGFLLAQCRSELAEALDDREARARSPWRAIFSPVAWWSGLRHTLVYHPAVSMAALLFLGFFAGVAGQRFRAAPERTASLRPVMTVSASPKVTEQQLQSAGSAHVAWVTPAGSRTPTVQVQLMSQTPTYIVGAPEDAEVQRALTYVLGNWQRFDSETRLDSLDVLRTCASEPAVRRALCVAASQDRNPGVRMKALEALRGFEKDPAVRQALVTALQNDENSGVRVQAVHNLLSAVRSGNGFDAPDAQTRKVLQDRMRNDPNSDVRLQSEAVLREFGE